MRELGCSPLSSPCEELRSQLWSKLKNFANANHDKWLVAEDFNDIASPNEKQGGAPTNIRKCNTFVDRISSCNLMDMGAIGSRFTWRGPMH